MSPFLKAMQKLIEERIPSANTSLDDESRFTDVLIISIGPCRGVSHRAAVIAYLHDDGLTFMRTLTYINFDIANPKFDPEIIIRTIEEEMRLAKVEE